MHFPKNGYSTPDFLKRMFVKTSCLFKTVRNSIDMDRNEKFQEINDLAI